MSAEVNKYLRKREKPTVAGGLACFHWVSRQNFDPFPPSVLASANARLVSARLFCDDEFFSKIILSFEPSSPLRISSQSAYEGRIRVRFSRGWGEWRRQVEMVRKHSLFDEGGYLDKYTIDK